MGVFVDVKKYRRRKGESEQQHRERCWEMEGRDAKTGIYRNVPRDVDGIEGSARRTQHLKEANAWIQADAEQTAMKQMAPLRAEFESNANAIAAELDYAGRRCRAFRWEDIGFKLEHSTGRPFSDSMSAWNAYAKAVADEMTFSPEAVDRIRVYCQENGISREMLCGNSAFDQIVNRMLSISLFDPGMVTFVEKRVEPTPAYVPTVDEQIERMDTSTREGQRKARQLLDEAAVTEVGTPMVRAWRKHLLEQWSFVPNENQHRAAMAMFSDPTLQLDPANKASYDRIRALLRRRRTFPAHLIDSQEAVALEMETWEHAGKQVPVHAWDKEARRRIDALKSSDQFVPSFVEEQQ